MEGGNVEQRVCKIVKEQYRLSTPDAGEDQVWMSNPFEELGDSLDVVELIMNFENEFDIEIPDDHMSQIKDTHAAVKYISERDARGRHG